MAVPMLTSRKDFERVLTQIDQESGTGDRKLRSLLESICSSIARHTSFSMRRPNFHPEVLHEKVFELNRTLKEGTKIASSYRFLLNSLCSRLGAPQLSETLMRLHSPSAVSIGRRLSNPVCVESLSLGALKVVVDGAPQVYELRGTHSEVGECARIDVAIPSESLTSISLAVSVDNSGMRTAFASGVEIRIQSKRRTESLLRPTGLSFFGMCHRIEAGKRRWIAFRGANVAAHLPSRHEENADLELIRVIVRRI